MSRRSTPLVDRFWAFVDRRGPDECWAWLGTTNARGYGLFRNGPQTSIAAHRQAFALTHGAILAGQIIMHRCDNPPCCNPAHLVAGSHQDNTDDCIFKGRRAKHYQWAPRGRRLTDDDVREIRASRLKGDRLEAIAARFNISLTTAHNIATRKRKAHVV